MNRFASFDFYLAFYAVEANWKNVGRLRDSGAPVLTPLCLHSILHCVGLLRDQCFAIGLAGANTAAVNAAMYLNDPNRDRTAPAVAVLLENVCNAVRDALSRRHFLWVNPAYNDFIDNEESFGSRVKNNFPSAVYDIREAGNCLAAECATAAVFHLMRAAEHGLRALAFDRNITVAKGPIELATWDQIIKRLEDAEDAVIGYPRTLVREEQL
jgi:hypothetical protein